MRARPLILASAVGLAALGLWTCGAEPDAPNPLPLRDGGGGSDAPPDAISSTSGGDATDGPPTCQVENADGVPEGWVSWGGWTCDCHYWIPGTPDKLPPPIQWELCSVITLPGMDCRQIHVDWPHGPGIPQMGFRPSFGRGKDGQPLIAFWRVAQVQGDLGSYTEAIVFEPDGNVLFALRRPGADDACSIASQDVNEGIFGVGVRGDGTTLISTDSKADGLVWGQVGDIMPHIAPVKDNPDELGTWTVGSKWLIQGIAPTLDDNMYSLDFKTTKKLWPIASDPEPLPQVGDMPRQIGSDVIFGVASLYEAGIMAYDDTRGVHPLVRWYGDATRGAGNVNTDGKDIVWSYGEGKAPNDILYPKVSIMAAPYTTDPASLQPKRLRSDPWTEINGNQFAVGCGYAGHRGPSAHLLIVRIADGVSWDIPRLGTWNWGQVLGITCDEVFAVAADGAANAGPTIARVKLSSLGPGLPPD